MNHRRYIVVALHAMRGADLGLCEYAETMCQHDLDSATDAARRLYRALRGEQRRRARAGEGGRHRQPRGKSSECQGVTARACAGHV